MAACVGSTVLREPAGYRAGDSYGLDECYRQLEAVWAGGVAAYTVMATVKDPTVRPREIKEYRDDGVFCIDRLEMRPDGKLTAVLGDFVPLRELAVHAQTFRIAAGEGPLPADASMKTGVSTDAFQLEIPAMRTLFEQVCRSRGTLTYTEVMERSGLTFYPLTTALGRLGHDCKREGEPIITAIVVDAKTRRCVRIPYLQKWLSFRSAPTDDEVEAALPCLEVGPDACNAALVSESQRRVALLCRPLHQFFGLRGPDKERERRAAVQLGIGRGVVARLPPRELIEVHDPQVPGLVVGRMREPCDAANTWPAGAS